MAQSCALAQDWVRENYERFEEGVVQKSVIHTNYTEYCRTIGRPIMETSIFGRVVKQIFPGVSIRRLGGRVNLKYYYCGIHAKATSPFVADNATATKPKRKQRKQEFADRTDVHNCLQWLQCFYQSGGSESQILMADMYNFYQQNCNNRQIGNLNLPQFTDAVLRTFSNSTKRKVGTKPQQKNVFTHIIQRPQALDPNTIAIPNDIISMFVPTQMENRNENFVVVHNNIDDDEDDSRNSPISNCSDMSTMTDTNHHYYFDEPVDYSLSTKLKEEPSSEPIVNIQEDNFYTNSQFSSYMPERVHPEIEEKSSLSVSLPTTTEKNKLYKPRFHANYKDQDWDEYVDVKIEPESISYPDSHKISFDNALQTFLKECLDVDSPSYTCVRRDQLYNAYYQYCTHTGAITLPLDEFDRTVIELFGPSIMSFSEFTVYCGVRISHNSDITGKVEEIKLPQSIEMSRSWGDRSIDTLTPDNYSMPDESLSPHNMIDDEDDECDESFPQEQYCREQYEGPLPAGRRDDKVYLAEWLKENFELVPEACVLKAEAYSYYEKYSIKEGRTPLEMNVFGKVVKKCFADISVRRLGGRNKPQYHYSGITAKPDSPLYPALSSKDPVQRSRKKEISTDNRSAEIAIDWLKRNYMIKKDHAIKKAEVYANFQQYCQCIKTNEVSFSYFGKLVKHCFTDVDARKSGGRTDSQWFYVGLCPVENESFNRSMSTDEFDGTLNMESSNYSDNHNTISSNHESLQSNPIAVPGRIISANDLSSYSDSLNMFTQPDANRELMYAQVMRHHRERLSQQSSSFHNSLESDYVFPPSPGLSRAFKDTLHTQSTAESGRCMIPSKAADAPEVTFPSPVDSLAQTSRSPASVREHLATISLSGGCYTNGSSVGFSFSSSPTYKRAQVIFCL